MKGSNFSSQRNIIYKELSNTDSHPTAKWIYEKLKPEYPNLSLATVYRNLKLFKDNKKIISVCVVDGEERYDAKTHNHAHFVCEKCKKVIDISNDTSDTFEDKLTNEGFEVERKNLVYYGKCKNCQQL